MKTILYVMILSTLMFVSCETPDHADHRDERNITFPERAKDMVIYEVNIRQFTPKGTFEAFVDHLPRIKKMGVDLLWLMPIQAIGEKKRKGRLGSYYSVRDYRKINPEFGNEKNFMNLVKKAHELNMWVIMDWIPNHTAWDHPWIEKHPDYYIKDENGAITMAHDWSDVAQLDYENHDMRKEMIKEMRYWIEKFDIDGFRQDHAGHEIPVDFWQDATENLHQIKDLFWLAEWNSPQMHFAFHATYAWEFHHLSGAIVRGEANANDIESLLKKDKHDYGKYAFRMNFTSNHDENSWQGTVFERYGEGYKTMAVLMATIDGIPLLYGGQEAAMDKRLRFFEKDTIDWSQRPLEPFYTTLFELRKNNPALWSGNFGGKSTRINANNSENIYAYIRSKDENMVIVLLNLSDEKQTFRLMPGYVSGTYPKVFTRELITLNSQVNLTLNPWEFQIFSINPKQ